MGLIYAVLSPDPDPNPSITLSMLSCVPSYL
jgi:hypothetical protein